MIYLTTKEFSITKGCSERYIKRLAKDGKIEAEKQPDKYNGYKYMIPLTELTPKQQIKWYQDNKLPVPDELLPNTSDKCIKSKNLSYEQLTDKQRKQAALWEQILEDWKLFVSGYSGGKTEANKAFLKAYSNKYPVKISVDILYRKQKIYKSGNIADLIDGRGLQRKGISCINENLWQAFLYYYLDQSQHPLTTCYYYTTKWAEQEHPDINEYDVMIYPDARKYRKYSGYPYFTERYCLAVPEGNPLSGQAIVDSRILMNDGRQTR